MSIGLRSHKPNGPLDRRLVELTLDPQNSLGSPKPLSMPLVLPFRMYNPHEPSRLGRIFLVCRDCERQKGIDELLSFEEEVDGEEGDLGAREERLS